eukprot:1374054-Amphidinium_carterae.1
MEKITKECGKFLRSSGSEHCHQRPGNGFHHAHVDPLDVGCSGGGIARTVFSLLAACVKPVSSNEL